MGEEVDRNSYSYKLKQQALQRAWRSSNPGRASQLIEQFLYHSRRRRMMRETESTVGEFLKKLEEETLDEKLSRRFPDTEERREVIREIRDAKGLLREACERREPGEHRDSTQLKYYIEMQKQYENKLRQFLKGQGISEDNLPEFASAGLRRLNAEENMRRGIHPEEGMDLIVSMSWMTEEDRRKVKHAILFLRKEQTPEAPSIH